MIGRLSAVAIFLGLVANTLAGLLIGALGAVVLVLLSPSDLAWFGAPQAAPPGTGVAVLIVVGALSGALVAGYAAARIAAGDELINAFAMGILLLILTAASYEEPWLHQIPLWCTIAIVALQLPLSLLGGYLQRGAAAA
jgi:hypothetical protein